MSARVTEAHRAKAVEVIEVWVQEDGKHYLLYPLALALADAEAAGREACAQLIDAECDAHPARGIVLREMAIAIRAKTLAGAATDEREVVEFPQGALINGQVLLQQLVDHYDFECEAGPLRNCCAWQDLERCFSALEEYAAAIRARSTPTKEKADA